MTSVVAGEGDERLRRLLGAAELAPLRHRLRRRFEQCRADQPPASLRLHGLAPVEQAALAALLGRRARNAVSMEVDVAAIDAALQRAGIAASLRDALERLDGRIADRAAERAQREAQWRHVRDSAGHGALERLLDTPAGLGLLKRLCGASAAAAATACRQAGAVLHRLPAQGIARAQLAAQVLGDAHALDPGAPVATLVLAAWRSSDAVQTDDGAEGRGGSIATASPRACGPVDEASDVCEGAAAALRDAWASAGVLVNELAKPALVLNLPFAGAPPAGEPAYFSLRRLLRSPPAWCVRERRVHVCENPNLLAIAADRLGEHCPPLVCTDGMPAAAQRTLLRQLAAAGATLLYHGDFDWPGLRIANHMLRAFGAQAWCFAATDYLAAALHVPRPGRPLSGTRVDADWDTALAPAMLDAGVALDEEALADTLLPRLLSEP